MYYLQASEALSTTLESHASGEFDPLHLNSYQLGGPECYSSIFDLFGRYALMLSLPIFVFFSLLAVWGVGLVVIIMRRKWRNVQVRRSLSVRKDRSISLPNAAGMALNSSGGDFEEEDVYADTALVEYVPSPQRVRARTHARTHAHKRQQLMPSPSPIAGNKSKIHMPGLDGSSRRRTASGAASACARSCS